jgi:hypothetical protein
MSALKTLAVTEDGFAFNTTTGESYTLNLCGRLMLKRLQQGENYQQIVNFLSGEFGIAQNTAERDVAEFVQQLNALGLAGDRS